MTLIEKETIINFNEQEDKATVYSCTSSIWTKCKKLRLEPVEVTRNESGRITNKTYEMPKAWINIRKPVKRKLTTERMAELRKQGLALLQKRKISSIG